MAADPRSDDLLPTTWEGGHALVIEYGDCEFYARCQCRVDFGSARPDASWDAFGTAWEKHVMTEVQP